MIQMNSDSNVSITQTEIISMVDMPSRVDRRVSLYDVVFKRIESVIGTVLFTVPAVILTITILIHMDTRCWFVCSIMYERNLKYDECLKNQGLQYK